MIQPFPRRLATVLLAALAFPVSALADNPRPARTSLTKFAEIKNVKAALLAPDGRDVACLVAVTDLKANRVRTSVWLAPVEKGEPRQFALPTDAIEQILWAPRVRQLAVVGKVVPVKPHEKTDTYLWIVDTTGGQAKRLVRIDRSNHYLAHQGASLCWSPDGAFLAYLASDAPAHPAADGPVVVSRIQYKTRTALSDNRPTHIWTVEVATGKTRQLTNGRFDEHSIDWSPKGDEIVFCSNRGPDPDANLNYDLYTVKVSDGTVQQLTKTPGSEMAPVWSPDGRSIAYTMTKRPATTIDSVAEDDHVWVLDCASGKARELSAKLDLRCSHVRWSPDCKEVCFLARDRGTSQIYCIKPVGGNAIKCYSGGEIWITSFSLSSGVAHRALVVSSPAFPSMAAWDYVADEGHWGVGGRRLAKFNDAIDSQWKPVKPREVNFRSFDGTPIHGWLIVPPGATAQNKVPLILNIHGGPHGMHGYQFSAPFQLMCARGYAILYLNPRGSSGYGQKFSDGCVNDWGGGDYKDLMAGVDHVLAKYPELDADRLGVMGGSYGGYMTDWIITQTNRFKAAVSYAGLSNLISFYGTSLYQDLMHVEFNGPPWEHYGLLWERSPLRHVKRVTTPTLFLHGEADNDVPITQSEEMYTALKQRGIETVFVRYPREGHGATEPRFQLDELERTVAWFDRFLQKK
jgi:dipeptidyl aminopeptidase/acylaminoacyl peptidase